MKSRIPYHYIFLIFWLKTWIKMLQKSIKMRSMHFFTAAFLKNQLTSVTNSRQTFIHCMLLPVLSKKIFVSYRNWCWFRQHCQMLPSLSLVRNLWSLVFKIMARLLTCSLAESFYNINYGSSIIRSKSLSKNLSNQKEHF